MKKPALLPMMFLVALVAPVSADEGNVAIDYNKFVALTTELAEVRQKNRISEERFLELSRKKGVVILIYCNNNFEGEVEFFPGKKAEVALNIPTFVNLHAYGYKNVHELKPLLDIKTTKIPFVGLSVSQKQG